MRVRRGVAGVREVLQSSKNAAPLLVELTPLRRLIVSVCLVNTGQSVPSDMVSLGISSFTGRSAPPNDVEALSGAYFAPGMWEMRRGGFAGGPTILESGYGMTELDPRRSPFVSPKYKNSIKRNGIMQSLVIEMDCASGVVAAMRANTYCALIGSSERTVRQLPILEAGRWNRHPRWRVGKARGLSI
jgi:hypothetical protein